MQIKPGHHAGVFVCFNQTLSQCLPKAIGLLCLSCFSHHLWLSILKHTSPAIASWRTVSISSSNYAINLTSLFYKRYNLFIYTLCFIQIGAKNILNFFTSTSGDRYTHDIGHHTIGIFPTHMYFMNMIRANPMRAMGLHSEFS